MNLEIYNKTRSVPIEAQKPIGGGRLKGMTDIQPMWRIKMLTEIFGVCGFGWFYEVTEQRLEKGSDNQIAAFVTINLFIKIDGEWSKPIIGIGGSSFVTNEKSGAYTSDECFKMALTDAISVACKALGFGADVYWSKDRTKYSDADIEKAPTKSVPHSITPNHKELGKLLMDSFGKEVGIQKLSELTTWSKDGKTYVGKTQIDKLTDKEAEVTLSKLKKLLKDGENNESSIF